MNHSDQRLQLDLAAARYLDAMERDDFTTMETIWSLALDNPELDAVLREVHAGLSEEQAHGAEVSSSAELTEAVNENLPSRARAIPTGPQRDFRNKNSDKRGDELERLRPYLHLVARMHLDYRLRSVIDPDDVVADVFLKALEHWDQCTGERKPWLRRILLNHLKDLTDKYAPRVALREELEHSSVRLDALLVADHSSPSQRAERNEDLARLAEALEKLPIKEQEVVILTRLHDQKLKDVADQLKITLGQAAGLLYRGLERLNRYLTFPE